MPAGDRQRTWFPEMVEALRAEWRAEMSWKDLRKTKEDTDKESIRAAASRTPNAVHYPQIPFPP